MPDDKTINILLPSEIYQFFIVKPSAIQDRIDVGFQNPKYFSTIKGMQKLVENPKLKLDTIKNLLSPSEKLKITGGATPLGATYLEEGITFIRVQNVRRNELVLEDVKYIPRFMHEGMLSRSQLKEDDVLLTITGVTYGLSATVPKGLGEANINQHSVRMRFDKEKILPKYISYFLNSRLGRIQTDRFITGSSRPALDYDAIKQLYILYPSNISEQEMIIKKTDVLIEKAKQHKEAYSTLIESLNTLILQEIDIKMPKREDMFFTAKTVEGRFDAKFSSPFLRELKERIKERPHAELRNLLEIADSGNISFAESYRLIELENIDEDVGEVSSIQTVLDLGSAKVVLKKDQIVVSQLQPETAKIFIVNEKIHNCLGSSELIPLNLISQDALPQYLWCILRSPYVLKQWQYETTGSTRDRIGERELYETLIPLPDKDKQREIVKRVFDIIEKAKLEKAGYIENLGLAESTFIGFIEK